MTDITLYYNSTPNGHKAVLALEEMQVPYTIEFVDIEQGDQFEEGFNRISPNNKIPAIVDHAPADGGEALSVFESGAILYYLADKYRCFLPADPRGRTGVMQWLFWQVAGLGPMAGQAHHFIHYAPVTLEYAVERYVAECARLYSVMDQHLACRSFLSGEYSVADMACWSWVMRHHRHKQKLEDFPHLNDWYQRLEARPAVVKTREIARSYLGVSSNVSATARQQLFTSKRKP